MKNQVDYVYALAYPDGKVFYIGKGQGQRIDSHEWEARRSVLGPHANTHKINIIRKIWASGGEVLKTRLAEFETGEEALFYEIALIFFMNDLTNKTLGGDGALGHTVSEEARRKMSQAQMGKSYGEERLRKMSEVQRGKELSAETRNKISAGLKGKAHSEETRRKLSEAHSNRTHAPHSEATRRKMSASRTGVKRGPFSEEHRRKLAEARRRRAPTGETHRKQAKRAALAASPELQMDSSYSSIEVAKMLKVSQMTVRRLIEDGELEAFKVGNQWRITQEALDRFMKKK